jgi:peptidoglycan-N-acetylglucosamine deacetylase
MKNRIIYIGTFTIIIILLLVGTYKLMNSRTFQVFGGLISKVETGEKVVALTFDDGPTNQVEDILPTIREVQC